MNEQEKEYIDKKFSELENRLLNPNTKDIQQIAKPYKSMARSYALKVYIAGLIGAGLVVLFLLRVLKAI